MKSLNDTFDIEDVQPIEGQIVDQSNNVIVPKLESVDQNVEYDYEQTRNNLHSLLAQGQEALLHALEVAKQSEHPRAFEVVGNLVKQLADVNHQLLDLSEKRQKLVANQAPQDTPKTVNNNAFFVGSTAELNKMIQNLNKGN